MSTIQVNSPQFIPQFSQSAHDAKLEKTGKFASALGLGAGITWGLKKANDHAWFGEKLTRGDIPALGAGIGMGTGAFFALSLSGKMLQKDEDLAAVGVAALGTVAAVGSTLSFAKAFNSNYWVGAALTMGVIGMTHLMVDAVK